MQWPETPSWCPTTSSACLVMARKIPAGLPQNSMAFCRELAHEARVALIPGSSFGPGGEGYVRISYAASMADLKTAVTRLRTYVASKKQGA